MAATAADADARAHPTDASAAGAAVTACSAAPPSGAAGSGDAQLPQLELLVDEATVTFVGAGIAGHGGGRMASHPAAMLA